MSKQLGRFLVVLFCCFWMPVSGSAQTLSQATLSEPQTDDFPRVTAFLDVRDEGGKFVSGLTLQDVTVLENGQPIPVTELQASRPGVQFVVAINPSRPFAIRDSQGRSRYDYLVQALEAWAGAAQGEGQDDLSLLATRGPGNTHLSERSVWLAALEAYQPELRSATPSLDVLSRALDVATDTPPRPGMGRAVLFITAPPDLAALTALQSATARATQAGIRVFVWMVASAEVFDSPAANALRELVTLTQGKFFAFSGLETLPDVEAYLEPLRHVYRLSYLSGISTSGTHELRVEVSNREVLATTPPQSFDLQIAPPNPVFVSPPAEINRLYPTSGDLSTELLIPESQNLEILIEFPDGHLRPVERTVLYVDGVPVAENTSPPFDRFIWDLSSHTNLSRHVLQVEVVDSLGLRGISIETPIQITIEQPRRDALTAISRNSSILAVAAIVMAGTILVFVLIVGGRIRPRGYRVPRVARRLENDPVTQPVTARLPTRPAPRGRLRQWTAYLQRAPDRSQGRPLAHLWPLANGDRPEAMAAPIPLTDREITLGSDADQVNLVLDDPSVEGLHARLMLGSDGDLHIKDQGSVAGTWVNYAPVSQDGMPVEHGDLIHIGRVGFRFVLGKPTRPRTPKIVYKEKVP